MNLALEKGVKAEVRLEVKLERSLGWLQMRLPKMAWEKGIGTFSGWGMAAGKVEVLLVVGGFDVDGGAEVRRQQR